MLVMWVWGLGAAAALLGGPSPRWWRREFTMDGDAELTGAQAWILWAAGWVLWPVAGVLALRHALYGGAANR